MPGWADFSHAAVEKVHRQLPLADRSRAYTRVVRESAGRELCSEVLDTNGTIFVFALSSMPRINMTSLARRSVTVSPAEVLTAVSCHRCGAQRPPEGAGWANRDPRSSRRHDADSEPCGAGTRSPETLAAGSPRSPRERDRTRRRSHRRASRHTSATYSLSHRTCACRHLRGTWTQCVGGCKSRPAISYGPRLCHPAAADSGAWAPWTM